MIDESVLNSEVSSFQRFVKYTNVSFETDESVLFIYGCSALRSGTVPLKIFCG